MKETDSEELDRIFSQASASKEVYERFNELRRNTSEFNRQLFQAKLHHQRVRNEGLGDDATAIAQRESLGGVVDKIAESYRQFETAIRKR